MPGGKSKLYFPLLTLVLLLPAEVHWGASQGTWRESSPCCWGCLRAALGSAPLVSNTGIYCLFLQNNSSVSLVPDVQDVTAPVPPVLGLVPKSCTETPRQLRDNLNLFKHKVISRWNSHLIPDHHHHFISHFNSSAQLSCCFVLNSKRSSYVY